MFTCDKATKEFMHTCKEALQHQSPREKKIRQNVKL